MGLNIILYKIFMGKKPNLSYLYIIRLIVYTYIYKPQNKLCKNAIKYILLSYKGDHINHLFNNKDVII